MRDRDHRPLAARFGTELGLPIGPTVAARAASVRTEFGCYKETRIR